MNIAKFLRTPILKDIYERTGSINSRSAIFQKSLVFPFKLNALASRVSWPHTHSVLTVAPFVRTQSIMLGFWFQKQSPRYAFFKKETLVQVFYSEFSKVSKSAFSAKHLRWLLLGSSWSLPSL